MLVTLLVSQTSGWLKDVTYPNMSCMVVTLLVSQLVTTPLKFAST